MEEENYQRHDYKYSLVFGTETELQNVPPGPLIGQNKTLFSSKTKTYLVAFTGNKGHRKKSMESSCVLKKRPGNIKENY